MTKKIAVLLFFVIAAIALVVHYFMFEMRYMWYVMPEDAQLMRIVYGACVAVIILLWAVFPSRFAVAILGFFALFFPHIFFAADERPLLGRDFDLPSIGIALIGVALLVLATHFRPKGSSSRLPG